MKTALCFDNRLPLFRRSSFGRSESVRFVVIAALLLLGLLPIGQLLGAEQDPLRADVLTFNSNQKPSPDTLTSDSFPVSLACKTSKLAQNSQPYYVILRGIDPIEKALLQDAQNGKWNRFDLFRAAMIVEGIRDPELIRTYETRLDALVAKVLAESRANGGTTPQALTRSLFEAMHREILTKSYSLHCTELSKVMSTGAFNCVSATVLFNVLAEKAGLDVCALEMPGHALSRVRFADGIAMNIETTAPNWFDLQTDKERQMATFERIVAPTPAQTEPVTAQDVNAPPAVIAEAELSANFRVISPVQLVATIYYNLGVDLHAKKLFPEAAAANVKALYLDKDNEQAWTNLLASLNNWALDLAGESRGSRYNVSTFILDQGVMLDPAYANFYPNQTYVFHRWISGLANIGRFGDARQVHELAKKRLPNNKTLQDLIDAVSLEEAKIQQQRR